MVFRAMAVPGSGGGGGSINPATLAKLVINSRIDTTDWAGLGITNGATGFVNLPAWDTPIQETGSAFDYSSASTIDVLDAGVYSVSITMCPRFTDICDPAMSLDFTAYGSTLNAGIGCNARGGDGGESSGGTAPLPTASYTYYIAATGDGPISFSFCYANFDAVNLGTVDMTATIQQIIPA